MCSFQHSPAILRALVASHSAALNCWQPDEAVSACFACGEDYTVLRRRHHCRSCLRVVCGACSNLIFAPPAGADDTLTSALVPQCADEAPPLLAAIGSLFQKVVKGGGSGVRKCIKCAPPASPDEPPLPAALLAPPFAISSAVELASPPRYPSLRELSHRTIGEDEAVGVEGGYSPMLGDGLASSLDAAVESPEEEVSKLGRGVNPRCRASDAAAARPMPAHCR